MENWDVFLVLVEVVAFVIAILSFSSKFNQSLGELRAVIKQLKETVEKMEKRSHETHANLYKIVNDHESRISVLESKDKGGV